jgi:site-specific DNA recombinase
MEKIAIYTRLSKEDETSNSIQHQLREGLEFAKSISFDGEKFDEGEGISGAATIDKRPEFARMCLAIEEGEVQAVWARDQNRLERSKATWAVFEELVRRNNVKLFLGDKEFHLDDANESLLGSIRTAVNQYALDIQSQKTKRAIAANVKSGLFHGKPPYGYKLIDRSLIINEEQVEAVRLIYNLSLNGFGTRRIANHLNELTDFETYETQRQAKRTVWRDAVIYRILTNSIYKGDWLFKSNIYPAPKIIDTDIWQRVNEKMPNNKINSGGNKHSYLLKGILICERCGRNYVGHKRSNNKDNAYKCSSSRHKGENCGNQGININKLEQFIEIQMFQRMDFISSVKSAIKRQNSSEVIDTLSKDVKVLQKSLKKAQLEKTRLVSALMEGLIEKEDIKSQMDALKEKIKKLSIQLFDRDSELKKRGKISDEFFEELNNISFKGFDGLRIEDRTNLIKQYIKNISINHFEPLTDDYKDRFEYAVKFELEPQFSEGRLIVFEWVFNTYMEYAYSTDVIQSNLEEGKVNLELYLAGLSEKRMKSDKSFTPRIRYDYIKSLMNS